MKNKLTALTPLVLLLCLLLSAGCAARVKPASETKAEISELLRHFDEQWETQDREIFTDMGIREFNAPAVLCRQLAEDTLWRIGFTILEEKNTTERVEAKADAPVPFSVTEWHALQKEIVGEMRKDAPKGYENTAQYLRFGSKNAETTAAIDIKEQSGKVIVSLQFGIIDHNDKYGYYAMQNPPPKALKMAYERFWYYFSRRLDKINNRQTVENTKQ